MLVETDVTKGTSLYFLWNLCLYSMSYVHHQLLFVPSNVKNLLLHVVSTNKTRQKVLNSRCYLFLILYFFLVYSFKTVRVSKKCQLWIYHGRFINVIM